MSSVDRIIFSWLVLALSPPQLPKKPFIGAIPPFGIPPLFGIIPLAGIVPLLDIFFSPLPPNAIALDSYEISIAPALRFLNCSATSNFPPVPMASTIIIVAEPTMIPTEVRITLNLFWERLIITSLNNSEILMFHLPCFQSGLYLHQKALL
ncbi:hypothetical protein IMSAGC011_03555 [Lachnospiraceae bacterium]|nr:hypothetical protein IMSAGC011_03555 [Lachnospiraceae bacterium]